MFGFFLLTIGYKYDNIFLSNLCTTTSLEKLKELLKKLDKHNLKDTGSILIGYLWNTHFDENNFKDDISNTPITFKNNLVYTTNEMNLIGQENIVKTLVNLIKIN